MDDLEPLDRDAVRVLLVGADDRVLLIEGHDPARPDAGWYWFTLGGGLDPGEDPRAGAVRELREECGAVLTVDQLGPVRREDHVEFAFEGRWVRQRQVWFVVRAAGSGVDVSGWTETEVRAQRAIRWWSAAELRATAETVYPTDVAELLAESIRSGWV